MTADKLSVKGWRNLADTQVEFSPEINVLFGDNAQGKTSLLESVWMFTGCRSFRSSRFSSLIKFGSDFARLELNFTGGGRAQSAAVAISGDERRLTLNKVENIPPTEFLGSFTAVAFTPGTLSLVKGEPEDRRRFTDTCICQVSREYSSALTVYKRCLRQRNRALKEAFSDSEAAQAAAPWNSILAGAGQTLTDKRREFMEKFSPEAGACYDGLSGGREKMEIAWHVRRPEGCGGDLAQILEYASAEDAARRTTCYGPHRDDLKILVDGRSAGAYGSQGQQRSCAVAMKLSEAGYLRDMTGETPVILLDDVLSELDSGRQEYILAALRDRQIFITCCEPTQALRSCRGRVYSIEEGRIS